MNSNYHQHYYLENQDKLKEYSKNYKENNKEKIKIKNDQYRFNNKETIKIKNKLWGDQVKMCECGTPSTNKHISTHRKTQKHFDLLDYSSSESDSSNGINIPSA